MNKFKVGDKVRVLAVELDFMEHLIGREFEIIKENKMICDRPYIIDGPSEFKDGDMRPWSFSEDELELVHETKAKIEYCECERCPCCGKLVKK